MRRGAVVLVLAMCLGCGSDPAKGRLATGDHVLMVGMTKRFKDGSFLNLVPVVTDRGRIRRERKVTSVPVGTKAVVLDDTDPPDHDGLIWVRIKVEDGEKAGLVGEVTRGSIRPVK